jgi:hypothetical protein
MRDGRVLTDTIVPNRLDAESELKWLREEHQAVQLA